MVSKQQKDQMKDYLLSRLDSRGGKILPVSKELVSGIKSNYILIGEEGVILLVDQAYPRDSFKTLHSMAKRQGRNIVAVLYKDGETFFRSATEKTQFKETYGLSLKNYSKEDLHKIILLRPEEMFLNSGQHLVQYYQPCSENLGEGIESFAFNPVHFDYSHINSHYRFKPQDADSKRLCIWKDRKHNSGRFVLEDSLLKAV